MTDLDRRTVLRGAALTGVVGACPLLAGCASDESGSGSAAPSSPSATQSNSGSPSAAASTGSEVEALASTSEVPVGGGKVFTEQKVVVTQPTKGDFVAFSAVCTHQGCIVATVSGGTINCGCHGSMFEIEDGSVANGPAQAPLPKQPITVQGNSITLA